jgi:hypothetical protein
MHGAKLSNDTALKFIMAGKAIFTALNSVSYNRFTFKVNKKKNHDVWFVSVLRGQDNSKDYTYFGAIVNGVFKHSPKSTITPDAQSVKVFAYLYSKLVTGTLPETIEIWHEGKCGKCGRMLTVPESIATGMGPECGHRNKPKTKREERQIKLDILIKD